MQVTTVVTGLWNQNCYLVRNKKKQLLIIDPGSNADKILNVIDQLDATPLAILNTHAHYDHIGAISSILKTYQIPFYLHNNDHKLMKQANIYKILFDAKDKVIIPSFDRDLSQELSNFFIGDFAIEVIHTPGHTSGSVCFLVDAKLFSGDTLMPNGPGRTDLPGGNKRELEASLCKLRELKNDYMVYPGHGLPFILENFWSQNFAF